MRNTSRGLVGRILLGLVPLALVLAVPAQAYGTGYDVRQTIVGSAVGQLGKPYVWAAAGPNAFDCSGLTSYTFAAGGMSLPHQSGMIWSRCDTIPASALLPGDLVFRAHLPSGSVEPTRATSIYHVGIYEGGGRVVEARGSAYGVVETSVRSFTIFGRVKAAYWPSGDRTYDQPPSLRGDFTGDGREDLAVFYGVGNGSRVYVMPSNGTTFGPAQTWFSKGAGWDWNRAKVVSGDFNGDGKADVAALLDDRDGTVTLWVLLSNGTTFSRVQVWWSSGSTTWDWSRIKVVAGDFNGDGKTDVGLYCDYGGRTAKMWVLRSTGSGFAPPKVWWDSGTAGVASTLVKLAAGDFTGDRRADVAMLLDFGAKGSRVWMLKSTGVALVLQPVWYSATRAQLDTVRAKIAAGDLDGDRRADLAVITDAGGATTKLTALVSNGKSFSARHLWTSAVGACDWQRAKLGTSDFEHHGRAGVVLLYDDGRNRAEARTFAMAAGGTLGRVGVGWDSGPGRLVWNRVK
jgi:hypothetical protein